MPFIKSSLRLCRSCCSHTKVSLEFALSVNGIIYIRQPFEKCRCLFHLFALLLASGVERLLYVYIS